MSSTSSQELADLASALNEPECEPSRSARSSHLPGVSLPNDGPMCPATETSESSLPTASKQMELLPRSSVEDSPARTSARPVRVLELMARAAASGQNMPDLLASFDHDTSLWRTSQHCLVEGLTVFSGIWPRSGTMRNGIAYQRPPLALATDATESGLWATPVAQPAGGTPERFLDRKRESVARGHSMGISLTDLSLQVQAVERGLWPTPTSQDNNQVAGRGAAAGHKKRGTTLGGAVRMWPTPNAGDFKAGMSNAPGRQQSSLPRSVGIAEGASSGKRGGLNPTWVEWLMGFPMGWTELKVSETPSSRKSRKSSGGQS